MASRGRPARMAAPAPPVRLLHPGFVMSHPAEHFGLVSRPLSHCAGGQSVPLRISSDSRRGARARPGACR